MQRPKLQERVQYGAYLFYAARNDWLPSEDSHD